MTIGVMLECMWGGRGQGAGRWLGEVGVRVCVGVCVDGCGVGMGCGRLGRDLTGSDRMGLYSPIWLTPCGTPVALYSIP